MISAVNTGGSLSLAWTLGTPGDNSLVVVSRNNFQHNPSQGLTYFADANNAYGDTNTMLGGNNEFVVYSGSATSVTVTNLGANNINYHFAVFEYNPNAGSPIYNTLAPNTNTFAGPGVITSAFLTTTSTNIPVGGAASAHLIASFSTGETSDQTVNSTFGSGDPTVFTVDNIWNRLGRDQRHCRFDRHLRCVQLEHQYLGPYAGIHRQLCRNPCLSHQRSGWILLGWNVP